MCVICAKMANLFIYRLLSSKIFDGDFISVYESIVCVMSLASGSLHFGEHKISGDYLIKCRIIFASLQLI